MKRASLLEGSISRGPDFNCYTIDIHQTINQLINEMDKLSDHGNAMGVLVTCFN
jgi:hypothetical protein